MPEDFILWCKDLDLMKKFRMLLIYIDLKEVKILQTLFSIA